MAPLLMFIIGYWAMGNRAIFYYDMIEFKSQKNFPQNPNHNYSPVQFDHLCYMLIIIVMLIFSGTTYTIFSWVGAKVTFGSLKIRDNAEVIIDEAIDPYF